MSALRVPHPRPGTGSRVATLRAEFDAAFASPVRQDAAPLVDVLTFRINQERCAVRLNDVTVVMARPAITPVPALVPSLLGLAAARGRLVAVHDLSTLLGGTAGEPRWLLVPAAEPSIGLTFEHFEGHRKVPADGTSDLSTGPLISLPAVIDAVRARHVQPPGTGASS